MDRETILDDVQRLADLDSHDAADRTAIETLRTLGEHVSAGEAEDLAAILPGDLGDAVTAHSDAEPDRFDPDTFAARVAEREGTDVSNDEAMTHVRAVMAAIANNGGRDELQDAREDLPNEYATIFETADLADA